MGISIDLIEPFGFLFSERRMRRAGMDYIDHVDFKCHPSWAQFLISPERQGRRLILLTPKAPMSYTDFKFESRDSLILGQESMGVPETVLPDMDGMVAIPMRPGLRSLNVAISGSMVMGEALRQTGLLPAHKS